MKNQIKTFLLLGFCLLCVLLQAQTFETDPQLFTSFYNQDWAKVIMQATKSINEAEPILKKQGKTTSNDEYLQMLYLLRGKSFYNLEDYEQAYSDLNRIIDKSKFTTGIGALYQMIGISAFDIGKNKEAIKYLDRSILNGEIRYSYTYRAFAKNELRMYDNAFKDLEMALKIDTDMTNTVESVYSNALIERATELRDSNIVSKAIVLYNRANEKLIYLMKQNPVDAGVFKDLGGNYYNLAKLRSTNEDYYTAKKYLKKSLEIEPNQPLVIDILNSIKDIKEEDSYHSEVIQLEKDGSVFLIPCELNNTIKVKFIFDTGASTVQITPDIASLLQKNGTIRKQDILEEGNFVIADGSVVKLKMLNLQSIKIGQHELKNVRCSVSANIDSDMLLGQSVLEKFGSYSFDYTKSRLVFGE